MDIDRHQLDALRTRLAELEDLVSQLGQQLDSLSEHLEDRFERHHSLITSVESDARRRDQDLDDRLDQLRSNLSLVERAVEQTTRGW